MKNYFDYKNFDKIVVTSKREKQQKIINDYALFGWEMIEVSDDETFSDLIHITFYRPHVIENKDELQYLQVFYEERLNKLSDLERRKNLLSSSLSVVMLVFLITLLVFFTLSLFKYSNIILSILFFFFIVVLGFLTVPLNKLRKRENFNHIKKIALINEDINKILKDVKSFKS